MLLCLLLTVFWGSCPTNSGTTRMLLMQNKHPKQLIGHSSSQTGICSSCCCVQTLTTREQYVSSVPAFRLQYNFHSRASVDAPWRDTQQNRGIHLSILNSQLQLWSATATAACITSLCGQCSSLVLIHIAVQCQRLPSLAWTRRRSSGAPSQLCIWHGLPTRSSW